MRALSMRDVFALVEREATWRELDVPAGEPLVAPSARGLDVALSTDGYARLGGVVPRERARALAAAVERLAERGLPAVFGYALDAFWAPLDGLLPALEAALGPLEVLADAWAWHIPAEVGRAGWPPHRGVYEKVRDSAGRPALVNVWLALSDVAHDTACLHVVPLGRDPGYPDELRREPLPTSGAVALEVSAGDALVWDANVVHWGGPMLPGARGARVSLSYTLRARAHGHAPTLAEHAAVAWRGASRRARLDLVAEQVLRYGHLDGRLSPGVLEWAATVAALQRRARPAG